MMESGGVPFTMNVEPSGCNNGNNNGWGGDSWWIILLFICLFGWGGFGGYGNNGGGANNPGFQGYATRSDITDGFAINNLQSGINAIQTGIADATYALNNSLQSGFNGLQAQICNLGAQLAQCLNKFLKAIKNLFTIKVNTVGTYA